MSRPQETPVVHVPIAAEFSARLDEAWAGAADVIPRVAAFLAVVAVGFVVAFVLRGVTNAVLERVGFDRAADRGGIRRALSHTPYDASDLLARVVFWAVVLFTLQLAFAVFGPNAVSAALDGVIAYLPRVFAAVLILVVAAAIAGVVREVVEVALGRLSYGRGVANAAGGVIVAVGVFAALTQLEVAPAIVVGLFYAILAAVVGIAVVAVGGAGIVPLRSRWERTLDRYDEERDRVAAELADADLRLAEHRRARATTAAPAAPVDTPVPTTPPSPADPAHDPYADTRHDDAYAGAHAADPYPAEHADDRYAAHAADPANAHAADPADAHVDDTYAGDRASYAAHDAPVPSGDPAATDDRHAAPRGAGLPYEDAIGRADDPTRRAQPPADHDAAHRASEITPPAPAERPADAPVPSSPSQARAAEHGAPTHEDEVVDITDDAPAAGGPYEPQHTRVYEAVPTRVVERQDLEDESWYEQPEDDEWYGDDQR